MKIKYFKLLHMLIFLKLSTLMFKKLTYYYIYFFLTSGNYWTRWFLCSKWHGRYCRCSRGRKSFSNFKKNSFTPEVLQHFSIVWEGYNHYNNGFLFHWKKSDILHKWSKILNKTESLKWFVDKCFTNFHNMSILNTSKYCNYCWKLYMDHGYRPE